MSDYIKEKVEEFREKFGKEQGKVLGGNAYIDMGTKLKYIESFLTQALQEMEERTRQEVIDEFVKVEKEKWDDAEHCSCLRHAIWKAMGEPEDKKFLALLSHKKESGEKEISLICRKCKKDNGDIYEDGMCYCCYTYGNPNCNSPKKEKRGR